jgi:hypothetical protein
MNKQRKGENTEIKKKEKEKRHREKEEGSVQGKYKERSIT